MLSVSPNFEDLLYQLAPVAPLNYRIERYRGDDFCVPLSLFTVGDCARLRGLYLILSKLLRALSEGDAEAKAVSASRFLHQHSVEEMVGLARELGRESFAARPSANLAKAIHDLRGGGLTPLLGQLELASRDDSIEETASGLFYLTRDHLKIMRNTLLGLDDVKREEDLRLRVHDTHLIVEKWNDRILHLGGRDVRLTVECRQATPIGECCLEFGALDRILYNLISNACRHTADSTVELVMFPVPDQDGRSLRFIFLNRLTPEDREQLGRRALADLFGEGISTTGSGLGLAIVSDLVRHAYGLPDAATAVEQGYVGASVIDGCFAAWFHWPRLLKR